MFNINFLLIYLVVFLLFGTVAIVSFRFIGSRTPKKLSIGLMLIYGALLLSSPIAAGFIVEDASEREEPLDIPHFYFEEVLVDYENRSLLDLEQDDFLQKIHVTEIPLDIEDFSTDAPLGIRSPEYGHNFSNPLIIEITDTVDQVVITQFTQRIYIDTYNIGHHFEPWDWSVDSNELYSTIPTTEINLYNFHPPKLALHFDRELQEKIPSYQNIGFIPREGAIIWIQLPEELEFHYRGGGPWRIKE
jgi:hypothetical protein